MAFVKIWIHAVWSTKNRAPFLDQNIREKVFDHIKNNAASKDIYIDSINGHIDHIHCLISLKPDQSIAKVIQLIKGESAFWINKEKLTKGKFGWQDEYFAISVSESNVSKVRNYINGQEAHHRKSTFQEEYDAFIKDFGFQKLSG